LIGRTPLVFAVLNEENVCSSQGKKEENAAVVKYLLDNGADPDKANDYAPHPAPGIGPPLFVCIFAVHIRWGEIACIS
jgi:hypothetical protein